MQGTIGRNVTAYAQKIEVPDAENGLHIRGNLLYEAKEEISNLDKMTVIGDKTFVPMPERKVEDKLISYVWNAAGVIVLNIIIYMSLMFFAPKFVGNAKEYISTRSLLAFGVGVAFTIAVPVVAILLLFTVVGTRIIIYDSIFIRSIIDCKYICYCNYSKRICIRKIKDYRK